MGGAGCLLLEHPVSTPQLGSTLASGGCVWSIFHGLVVALRVLVGLSRRSTRLVDQVTTLRRITLTRITACQIMVVSIVNLIY